MRITFDETLSNKEWIHKELLNSLPYDVINKARKDKYYEVKLLVNGIELEPKFFNDIVNGIDKYVDKQAGFLVKEKFEEAEQKVRNLTEIFDRVTEKIKEEFKIDDDD